VGVCLFGLRVFFGVWLFFFFFGGVFFLFSLCGWVCCWVFFGLVLWGWGVGVGGGVFLGGCFLFGGLWVFVLRCFFFVVFVFWWGGVWGGGVWVVGGGRGVFFLVLFFFFFFFFFLCVLFCVFFFVVCFFCFFLVFFFCGWAGVWWLCAVCWVRGCVGGGGGVLVCGFVFSQVGHSIDDEVIRRPCMDYFFFGMLGSELIQRLLHPGFAVFTCGVALVSRRKWEYWYIF